MRLRRGAHSRDCAASFLSATTTSPRASAKVSNAIRLLDLPENVLDLIENGKLSAGQARPLLALSSVEARIAAAQRIVASGITARGAEEIAAAHRKNGANGTTSSKARAEDPNLNALVDALQRALKRKVRVIRRRGKSPGRVEIDFYDENDLTALAAMLTGATRQIAAHA